MTTADLLEGLPEFTLVPDTGIARAAAELGVLTFHGLCRYVERLSYRRVSDGLRPEQVLIEKRGTCSSKHRLLAVAAREAGRMDVDLVVGLYLMNETNTPGVGDVLGSMSIPEAHCYLQCRHQRFDLTGLPQGVEPFHFALLSEHVVDPCSLAADKARLHIQAMRAWAATAPVSFEEAWAARERCIARLERTYR